MVTSSCLEFELEEEKFRLLLKTPENAGLWLENSTFSNKLIFSPLSFDFCSKSNSSSG